MKFTHWLIEIHESDGHDGQGNDRQVELLRRARDEPDFLFGNTHGLGENVHAIKPDARDVLEAGGGVDADLLERGVDNAELHARQLTERRRGGKKKAGR